MNMFSQKERGDGSTYLLLSCVADTIQDGQPIVVVVMESARMVDYARDMLYDILKRRALPSLQLKRKDLWVIGNCEIRFTTILRYPECMYGLPPCEFVDHSAVKKMSPRAYEYLTYEARR